MTQLPEPTSDLDVAKRHMDKFGYCLLKDALGREEVDAIRSRLLTQLEAELERGVSRMRPDDKKQLIRFLINKGQVFRDMIVHPGLHEMLRHVIGDAYLLSSYHAHVAHPGSTMAFHTDQFWMPPPTTDRKQTLVKPGSITRSGNRGRHVGGEVLMEPDTIAPAVTCNAMWMIDDYTAENGATLLVPGSHLSGRQPDPVLDSNANWVPATGPAGTAVVFEGRIWHTTGINTTDRPRIGLSTNFCAPQFRPQENYLLGTLPEVLEEASPELLALMGFRAWQGYGTHEGQGEWLTRGEYAWGELTPEEQR